MRQVIEIVVGSNFDYTKDLKRRMAELDISQNKLADEMGLSASQVSRWFTSNKERAVEPSMKMVAKIETALVKLQEKRKKEQAKKP